MNSNLQVFKNNQFGEIRTVIILDLNNVSQVKTRLGVRVRFKNGIWLHYGTDGSWY